MGRPVTSAILSESGRKGRAGRPTGLSSVDFLSGPTAQTAGSRNSRPVKSLGRHLIPRDSLRSETFFVTRRTEITCSLTNP